MFVVKETLFLIKPIFLLAFLIVHVKIMNKIFRSEEWLLFCV